jgi:hypothetical protein
LVFVNLRHIQRPKSAKAVIRAVSLDHAVRAEKHRLRNRDAEGVGGLEVDDQLGLRRLFDGQVAGLRTLRILST